MALLKKPSPCLPVLKNLPSSLSLLLSSVFFLAACGGKSNNDEVIKALEENLSKSNISINYSTTTILKDLEGKTTDWATRERATIWYDNVEKIVSASKDLYSYLTTIKKQGNLSDLNVNELIIKLVQYKASILNSDSAIWYEFKNYFDFLNPTLSLLVKDTLASNKLESKKMSNAELSAILTLLQNYIKINENRIAAFCHSKVGQVDGLRFFESYSAIVGQNSTILNLGDELEIKAGIGLFSYAAQPKININGTAIDLNEEGIALSKIKISRPPGNYKVPVKISYKNQVTGKEEIQEIFVKYTVAKPCN